MDQGIYGSRDIWIKGYMDLGIYESMYMDQGIYGSRGYTDQGLYGYRDMWIKGYMDQGIYGSRDIGINGYTV